MASISDCAPSHIYDHEGQQLQQSQTAAIPPAHQQQQQQQQRHFCWPFFRCADVQSLPHTGSQSVLGNLPREQPYKLPVDEESKAVVLRLCSFARPHMRAWHLSWLVLFVSFVSTFSPAALLPVLQDSLDLTTGDIAGSNIASVAGAIVFRMVVGSLVDHWGPRYSASLVLLATAPAVFCMALVQDAAGLKVLRLFSGLSLCTFVVGQAWVSAMFSTRIVGTATALSAGWGNAGGGAALLIMPLLDKGIEAIAASDAEAWRWSFLVPGIMQVLVGMAVLLASDDEPKAALVRADATRGDSKSGSSGSNSRCELLGQAST
jgi:NNP family nitrate/nitrite transporter-like MFS transporter